MILLHKPYRTDLALELVKDCLNTNWVSSAGKYVNQFEREIAEYCGVNHAVAVVNGTSALHLSLIANEVGKGDLVILPNLTFVASANPVFYTGAKPIFIDVEKDSWQMDLDLLEEFLDSQTELKRGKTILKNSGETIKAIIPVHLLGNVMEMDRLLSISKKHNLILIEDAAEAMGSKYKNQHAGSFAEMGCLSFNGNKIMTTGGGGMIITNDEKLAKKVRHLSTQAKSNSEEYFHDQIGFNYRMTNVAAALGLSQLSLLPDILERKKKIAEYYRDLLPDYSFQKINFNVQSNHWIMTIKVPNKAKILKEMRQNNIQVRSLWIPLNQLPMYDQAIYFQRHDVSSDLYQTCLSLPSSPDLEKKDQDLIINLIKNN